jgi:hypothetical protein
MVSARAYSISGTTRNASNASSDQRKGESPHRREAQRWQSVTGEAGQRRHHQRDGPDHRPIQQPGGERRIEHADHRERGSDAEADDVGDQPRAWTNRRSVPVGTPPARGPAPR